MPLLLEHPQPGGCKMLNWRREGIEMEYLDQVEWPGFLVMNAKLAEKHWYFQPVSHS